MVAMVSNASGNDNAAMIKQTVDAQNLVSIQDEFLKNAAGLTVFWTLSGHITRDALIVALRDAGLTKVEPPDEPSAIVGLHRAVHAVAKTMKLQTEVIKRGEYAIVGEAKLADEATGKELTYAVHCHARVEDGETLVLSGEGADLIRQAYDAARKSLAPSDIGTWLCDKLRNLRAIPLRDRGGVYFVPADKRPTWLKVVAALNACSRHKIHTIPAMKGADAVAAILAALTTDTMAAVEEIDASVRGEGAEGKTLGVRALKHREEIARELLDRVEHYEKLLGKPLEDLRQAMTECQGAIAGAIMAAASAGDGQ